MYAGGDPGVLFTSRDGGATFELNQALFKHPTRPIWQPGAGGLCLHSIVPWPGDPQRLAIAISAAGVWLTDDAGATWRRGVEGLAARYVPDDAPDDQIPLCVHRIHRAPTRPERLFLQFHGGVYRSDDAGESWTDIGEGLPSDFGFALAIDPADADSAYVIPLLADIDRVTPDGKVRVYETRDAGASWTARGDGLPDEHAYLTILREAMDWTGEGDSLELYFGATSGTVFGSADGGRAGTRWPPTCRPSTRSPRQGRVDRDLDRDGGPAARRGLDLERAVERVDAVAQPAQAGAGGRVRPAHPVVAHLDAEPVVLEREFDRRGAGPRVLGDVGERLGGDEVRARLDLVAERVLRHARSPPPARGARGERLERRRRARGR